MRNKITRNGYILIYDPNHHRASTDGYVYEHVVVVENKIKRKLLDTEEVHHLNFKRDDNRIENLIVLSKMDHAKLHSWIKSNEIDNHLINNKKNCLKCNKEFVSINNDYCSAHCKRIGMKRKDPSKNEKIKLPDDKNEIEELMKNYNNSEIARMFSVTEAAVRKKIKKFNLKR